MTTTTKMNIVVSKAIMAKLIMMVNEFICEASTEEVMKVLPRLLRVKIVGEKIEQSIRFYLSQTGMDMLYLSKMIVRLGLYNKYGSFVEETPYITVRWLYSDFGSFINRPRRVYNDNRVN